MTKQEELDEIKAAIREGWFANYELGAKARPYVGQFFDRQRIGKKIVAKVVGNHGTYIVSLNVLAKGIESACSCYIGRGGGCHHCRALAQTFLNDAESFQAIRQKKRGEVRTLDDLEAYLKGVTLDALLQELKAQGIPQKDFAESIGMSSRHLSAIKSSESRNRFFHELGATKLACLWVIERFKPIVSRRSKAR
jgi:uncharacterized Zn finger protein